MADSNLNLGALAKGKSLSWDGVAGIEDEEFWFEAERLWDYVRERVEYARGSRQDVGIWIAMGFTKVDRGGPEGAREVADTVRDDVWGGPCLWNWSK